MIVENSYKNSNLTGVHTDIQNLTTSKANQTDLSNVSTKADNAIYRLGEGRVSMGWNYETLSLNFYVDGVFVGRFIKP
ncbi:hypothetical protein LBYZC6_13080 [Lacrimispora brassicae]